MTLRILCTKAAQNLSPVNSLPSRSASSHPPTINIAAVANLAITITTSLLIILTIRY